MDGLDGLDGLEQYVLLGLLSRLDFLNLYVFVRPLFLPVIIHDTRDVTSSVVPLSV